MRLKVILPITSAAIFVGAGTAIPAFAGDRSGDRADRFFVAHNYVEDVPVATIARAVEPKGADLFVQHLSLGANQESAWHTHPGPVVVTIRSGSLTYQDAGPNSCRDRTYTAGQGFVDPGFGHVHRVIAGPSGWRSTRPSSSLPGRRTI